MKTRMALTAQKPAFADLSYTMCLYQAANGASGLKSVSDITFTSSELSAIADSRAASAQMLSPVADASFAIASDRIQSQNDGDFFAVSLVAGKTYTFSLRGSGASPLSDPLLALFVDPEGNGFELETVDDDRRRRAELAADHHRRL
jgi:hypothetical protein